MTLYVRAKLALTSGETRQVVEQRLQQNGCMAREIETRRDWQPQLVSFALEPHLSRLFSGAAPDFG